MVGIYKIENLINGKVYIGQSIDIKRRWTEHRYSATHNDYVDYNSVLYQAINKYGLENFKFSVVEECSQNELDEREKYWISFYHSYVNDEQSNGYNLTLGGQGNSQKISDEQKLYLILWNEGYSTCEIEQITHKSYRTIQHFLKNECETYSLEESKNRWIEQNKNKYKINLYDKEGKFIKEFSGTYAAAKELGISYEKVLTTIQNKYNTLSDGSFFIYSKLDQENEIKAKLEALKDKSKRNNRNRKVAQIDIETNEIIHIFNTLQEASLAMSGKRCCTIGKVCNGRGKTAYGYKWSYIYND